MFQRKFLPRMNFAWKQAVKEFNGIAEFFGFQAQPMPLLCVHPGKLVALLDEFTLPARQFVGAVGGDRQRADPCRPLVAGGRPGSILGPCESTVDETTISCRIERARQSQMMILRLALQSRSLAAARGSHPFDGNVEIAYPAKMAIQPFQLEPYLLPFGVSDHRREENDCRA